MDTTNKIAIEVNKQTLEDPDKIISTNANSKRKIHFADEKGLNLEDIRYFEIEDGERGIIYFLS